MEQREELKKQFETRFPYLDNADISMIFDFFYSEIEQERKTKIDWMNGCADKQKKISHLEALVVAADEVEAALISTGLKWPNIKEALEKYNTLKANH